MKRHVHLILVLMSLCVLGIVGLQLYWNYQHYRSTVKAFDQDINEALTTAVAQETGQRQDWIGERFKGWLADSSLITITADHHNRDSNTVFYFQDTHPRFAEDKNRKMQFGLSDFKERLDHITPRAKVTVIDHFANRILKRDLQDAVVYHYTQLLGDSLESVFNASKVNLANLTTLLRTELSARNILAPFVLNPLDKKKFYLTKPVNTNFRKPYKNDFVYAGFESPDNYFFRKMKGVVIASLLLIGITIACFIYTLKTLLSQQKLAELKQAFVNNMTHELNTPISSIKITAESLRTFQHQPERQTEYLDIIAYQADKLSDLTEKILQTSQLRNAGEKNWSLIDLSELIAEAVREMRPQTESKQAQISISTTAEPVIVRGERSGLRNVLTNILDNALKYTIDTPIIHIRLSRAEASAELAVADNGIGIPPAYQDKVFEQFFRVPQGNLHDVKGFGLGLNYVSQVIRQHKGLIAIKANQPAGSVITLKLPLC
jgi:signal transduction histidine kinase